MIELLALIVPFLWSGTPETGYYQVWLFEVDEIHWCGESGDNFVACYYHTNQFHTIHFLKSKDPFAKDMYNCNTSWDHEWLHSMKIQHGQYPLVTC